MAAGIHYPSDIFEVERELCNIATIYRLSGGFNLVTTSLDSGSFIPPFAPLSVNFTTRKATVVKNVRVYENAAQAATSIKVVKGSAAYVNMFVGDGTKSAQVTAIDKTNAAYDLLTVTLAAAVTAGQTLFETADANATTPKNVCNFMNYARVKVEEGASITAVGQAFEIVESKLYLPLCAADKTSLGARFMFV